MSTSILLLTESTAHATNYFSWGAESMTPMWGSRGSATGASSLRSSSAIDCAVRRSGSCSLKVQPTGAGTNESTGIDLNGIPPPYPMNYLGSQLYYRWWMRIEPGFSWGDNSGGWAKVGRTMTANTASAYYTGFISGSRFIIQECNYRDGGNYIGDCHTTAGTPSLLTGISIPYNLAGKADGQWHEYIARVKVNTSTGCTPTVNCDADWEMYVDGASVGRYQNFKLAGISGANATFTDWWGSWMTNPYFQMASSVKAGGTIYLDDYSTDDVWNSLVSPGGPGGGGGPAPTPTPLPAGLSKPLNLRFGN